MIVILVIVLLSLKFFLQFKSSQLPYTANKLLLTKAELSFAKVLEGSLNGNFRICPKVRMLDVFSLEKGISRSEYQAAFNKISRKHFDFVLVDPNTYEIHSAIELDDKSHGSEKRRERDSFVEDVCEKAGLKLFRFKAQYAYSPKEISETIFGPEVVTARNKPADLPTAEVAPICSKCGSQMVMRKSNKPEHAEKKFWACPGYPNCRNIIEIKNPA